MLKTIPATEADFDKIWPIFQSIVKKGGTYVYRPDISFEEAKSIWFAPDFHTFLAYENDELVGAYVIRPNHRDLGSHVANAAYVVSLAQRSKGYGEAMGADSFIKAKALGYTAMQFNYVISTNKVAVNLWQKLGFKIVGTVPKVHRNHIDGVATGEEVDIHIMHKFL